MTCTHAALKRREFIELAFKYDNLLMEEAGQILEIETFIPMLLQVCVLGGGGGLGWCVCVCPVALSCTFTPHVHIAHCCSCVHIAHCSMFTHVHIAHYSLCPHCSMFTHVHIAHCSLCPHCVPHCPPPPSPCPPQRQDAGGECRLKRVVLIGDHHQLPPVVQNMAIQKYSHLDQPLFTRFIRLGTPYVELNAQVGRAGRVAGSRAVGAAGTAPLCCRAALAPPLPSGATGAATLPPPHCVSCRLLTLLTLVTAHTRLLTRVTHTHTRTRTHRVAPAPPSPSSTTGGTAPWATCPRCAHSPSSSQPTRASRLTTSSSTWRTSWGGWVLKF